MDRAVRILTGLSSDLEILKHTGTGEREPTLWGPDSPTNSIPEAPDAAKVCPTPCAEGENKAETHKIRLKENLWALGNIPQPENPCSHI